MRHIILFSALLVSTGITFTAARNDDILQKFFPPEKISNKNRTVLEGWQNLENRIKGLSRTAVKMLLPVVIENYDKINLSQKCITESFHLVLGLRNFKPWAVRFIDSSAKMIDGLMEGSVSGFGSYDECVGTEVKSLRLWDKGKTMFRGQYCTIQVSPPLPARKKFFRLGEAPDELKPLLLKDTVMGEAVKYAHFLHFFKLSLGICIPSGCSLEDINKVVNKVGNAVSVNATATRCEVKEQYQFPPIVIAAIICYGVAIILLLVGTSLDVYAQFKQFTYKSKLIRAFLAFSFYTNFRKFTNTETASKTLSCLNGIRFLGMTWIILGHTYLNVNFRLFNGLFKAKDYVEDFFFQAVINGQVSVDTFFFIGGLLVCYLSVILVRFHGHRFNIWVYILHRFWRILPVYCFVLLLVFTKDLFGSGPVWHETTYKHFKSCQDNWWTNLLFINNFYDRENMCLLHSWYLTSDVQLYIGSLVVLLPMLKWPKVGVSLSVVAIIFCIMYSGVVTYIYDYPPTALVSHPDIEALESYILHFYSNPIIHIAPYCLGLLTGYLLVTKPHLKIPPRIQWLGWCLAITINMSVLYGPLEWNKGNDPELWTSIMYASFFRTAWTLGVAWMIICCATGHGGIINYILSWKAFVPLGRLTYTAYLLHPLVQLLCVANVRYQVQIDHYIAVWIFLGNLCITYAAAFCLSMLIESPFLAWEKLLMPETERKDKIDSFMKEKNNLNGCLKSEKNSVVISSIITKTDEAPSGMDNKCIVYNL